MTVLECPEGTVPGVLDENDMPTMCVGDLPLVEPLPTRDVVPIPGLEAPIAPCPELCVFETVAPQPELPATGPTDPLVLAAIGFALLAAGFALWAAWSFSRSRLPRKRRASFLTDAEPASPEVAGSVLPNLLHK